MFKEWFNLRKKKKRIKLSSIVRHQKITSQLHGTMASKSKAEK